MGASAAALTGYLLYLGLLAGWLCLTVKMFKRTVSLRFTASYLIPLEFEHEQARLVFEADIFWATEAIGADELTAWLSVYQLSREMEPRGIVEVDLDD